MEILLFVLMASLLFPGSKGAGFELMMIPVFIICAALVIGVLWAVLSAGMWVADVTDNGWLGVAASFATFGILMTANKFVAEWDDRRRARASR